MPRHLLASPSDLLTFSALSFFATLVAGVTSLKMLTWQREKHVLTASRFAAGVFLGTAMLDLLSESEAIFHVMRFKYPIAFLLSCTGYSVAMLADCLLAYAVRSLPKEYSNKSHLKSFDKIMLALVYDLEPTKCCDTSLPVGTSKAETMDCDGIGYLRHVILYRVTLFLDWFYLWFTLGVLSMGGGVEIGSAETKTIACKAFLATILHNMIYIISFVFTVTKSVQSVPFAECLFVVLFSLLSPGGIMLELISTKVESSLGNEVLGGGEVANLSSEIANLWTGGVFTGIFSGVLVYLSVHHLLADGYELERSVFDTRFGKFVPMVVGVGVIALLKVLDV